MDLAPRPSEICEDCDAERRNPPKIEPAACNDGEKSEKPLSSLLVFLNDWLNFRVRDQFEINAGP